MNTPILILGYERSGTTMLRRLVSMHPGLSYDLVHERPKVLFRCKGREDAVRQLTFQARQEGKETRGRQSILSGQKIAYARVATVRKTLSKFKAFFEHVHIIHIMRDPVYSISSQVRKFHRNSRVCTWAWFHCVPKVIKLLVPERNVRTVWFEDICGAPQETLTSLYAWMGEEVPAAFVSKVISTRDPWEYNGRIMSGLRYFDTISAKKPAIVLPEKLIASIRSKMELLQLPSPHTEGALSS